jgi:hypothetical protein
MALFQMKIVGSNFGDKTQYAVARDGRFLVNQAKEESVAPITLIQNWNPEGRK